MTVPRHGIAVTLVLIAALSSTAASADEFTGFRVPEHRVLLWNGSLSSSTQWYSREGALLHARQGSSSGILATDFYSRHEAESRLAEYRASLTLNGLRQHEEFAEVPRGDLLDHRQERSSQRASAGFQAYGFRQWYPGGGRWNLVAMLRADLSEDRNWDTRRSRSEYAPPATLFNVSAISTDTWVYGGDVSGTLGAGVGRVRNATGVFEARVLERRLLDAGALSRGLGAAARDELAALMYARSDYSASLESPASTVWGAIEGILRRDGALASDSLGARALFGATTAFVRDGIVTADGLPASPVLRMTGWSARAILTGITTQVIQREAVSDTWIDAAGDPPYRSESYSRYAYPDDEAWAGAEGEFHRPVGLRVQLDASARVVAAVNPSRRGFEQQASVSAAWLVTGRWLATGSLQQQRRLLRDREGDTRTSDWSVSGSGRCEYWVSDHVDLALELSQSWNRTYQVVSPYPPIDYRHDDRGRVSFGLDYRFAGFTRIPGLPGL